MIDVDSAVWSLNERLRVAIVLRYTDSHSVEEGLAFVPLVTQSHRMTSGTGRHSHDDTILRTKMALDVILRVPPAGGPPLVDVLRVRVSALAAFHVSNQFFMPIDSSTDPNVLIADRLHQTIEPDLEVPGGYIVRWQLEEPSITVSQRKGDGVSSGPYVNFGLMWIDPAGVSDPFNGYIFDWWARVLIKTWWGSTHP